MKINEIFFSIQGESSYAGLPTVFVRTSGCPLRCKYCDTTYAYYDGEFFSPEILIEKINAYSCKRVCLTGGEPLAQKESLLFMQQLADLNFTVSLETSGSFSCQRVDPRIQKVIDIKTPDSGEEHSFDHTNLQLNQPLSTEFKFVLCSEKDFDWAENFCTENKLIEKGQIYYSPSHDQIKPEFIAKLLLSHRSPARLQLQLHKYLWPEVSQGV